MASSTFVAVVVTFVVSAGLVRSAAEQEARRTLGRYALLVADGAVPGTARPAGAGTRVLDRVASVRVVRVHADGSTTGAPAVASGLPASVLADAAGGVPVDAVVTTAGRGAFVAGRPVPAGDGSVLLVQPRAATGALTTPLRDRVLVALVLGLLVAVATGVLLARRLARPLEHAATAAARLARGDRAVQVEAEGPAEVAAVSDALNALAGALAVSEDRQRQFLLSVSHELRTPLTSLTGYAEALADGVVPTGQQADVGRTMVAEAGRLSRLVSDLLDLARLGAADFRILSTEVDLAALVREAGAVWADRCAQDGVLLRVEVPAAPVRVLTDAARVRQVLDNLAENALRVVPAGAPVVLALHVLADAVELQVRDGGPGLRDDDLAVAFDRSVLHDRYRGVRPVGTGLGLALVAGLAARLGGHATAGHAPEGGAAFTVRLPRGA
jgi:two-component system OmpR family sensor kinase